MYRSTAYVSAIREASRYISLEVWRWQYSYVSLETKVATVMNPKKANRI